MLEDKGDNIKRTERGRGGTESRDSNRRVDVLDADAVSAVLRHCQRSNPTNGVDSNRMRKPYQWRVQPIERGDRVRGRGARAAVLNDQSVDAKLLDRSLRRAPDIIAQRRQRIKPIDGELATPTNAQLRKSMH